MDYENDRAAMTGDFLQVAVKASPDWITPRNLCPRQFCT